MDLNEPVYLKLLREKVKEVGSIQKVADEIGISRTSASLLLSGKYTANTDKVAATIVGSLTNGRFCPHLQTALSEQQCESFADRPQPMSDPQALRHWYACANCEHSKAQETANAQQ